MSIELLTHLKEERKKLDQVLSGLGDPSSAHDQVSALAGRFVQVASEIDAIVRGSAGGSAAATAQPASPDFNKQWEDLFEVLLDLPPALWQKPEIAGPVQSLTEELKSLREKLEAKK